MHFRTDITYQWRSRGRKASTPITILSPYITGDCALRLVKGKPGARVYTLFEPFVFATGGSSIDSIAELVKEPGCEVFHLDRLHAKVVMDEETFASLGSQNVTHAGSNKNLELSVCLTGDDAREEVRKRIEPWLNEARLVTQGMVDDMVKALPALEAAFNGFYAVCQQHQREIDSNEQQRQLELQRQEKAEKRSQLARTNSRIRQSVDQAVRSKTVQYATVRQQYSDSSAFLDVTGNGQLLEWTVGKRQVTLKRLRRYLCVLEDGSMGWARVAAGQITKIGRAISLGEGLIEAFPEVFIVLSMGSKQIETLPEGANLSVELHDDDGLLCTVPMTFDLTSISAFPPEVPRPKISSRRPRPKPAAHAVLDWLTGNSEAFKQMIWSEVAESYESNKGNKLMGVNANQFFGPLGTQCRIRLAVVRSYLILDVTRL